MITAWIAAIGPFAKTAFGFLRRFWPVIVIVLAVFHYVGLRVKVSDQAHIIESQAETIKAGRASIAAGQSMRVAMRELEAANAELAATVDRISTDAAEWEAAAAAAAARPPVVRVEYRDRVDGTTPETMAATGQKIASEIATAVKVRREGGGP